MTPDGPLPDSPPPPSPAWRIFAIPGVAALIGYVSLYVVDSRLRVSKGPWEVTFRQDAQGVPCLDIQQPVLGIPNVTIRLLDEHLPTPMAAPSRVRFDAPQRPLPFGTNAFDDLMYLPGTVVLHCFGHEIQMLPRALFLDRKEYAWSDATNHNLVATDKLPSLDPPKKRGPQPSPRPN